MTIAKYRLIDLIVLTLLCVIIDVVGFFVSQSDLIFFYVTLSTPVLLIIYIRWDYRGLLSTLVVALLHIILYRNFDFLSLILYMASIMSISTAMIWFKLVGRNQIKQEVL
ncbi:MAG: hypothetical protein CVV63_03820, partial [Tenericutes bacterium HGW-Tenericutes-8]